MYSRMMYRWLFVLKLPTYLLSCNRGKWSCEQAGRQAGRHVARQADRSRLGERTVLAQALATPSIVAARSRRLCVRLLAATQLFPSCHPAICALRAHLTMSTAGAERSKNATQPFPSGART